MIQRLLSSDVMLKLEGIYDAKHPREVNTKVTGRGGTSFIPVINHINETGAYKKCANDILY